MGRLLASLRSRVFAATALVAVLPIVGALAFVTSRAARQAEDELRRGIEEASRLVAQYHRVRRETGRERTRLVADLPRLKAAVATGDPPTVEDTARDYRERVDADVLVVRDAHGRTLASLGLRTVPDVGGMEDSEAYVVDRGRLLETFGAPLLVGTSTPELLGHLTLGFALDDGVAARLRALTGSHVVIAHEGRVLASSLPRPIPPSVLSALGAPGLARVEIDGDDWVGMTRSFGPTGRDPLVLVLRSRAEAMRPLRTLRTALLVAALVAVAISLLLSWALARTVTRPLAALTDGMKQVAATGDLTRKIGPGRPWDDEDARLVARTFNILTDSVARFQKEAALRDRLTALGRLSTVIAHEVRNPLMIIKGSLRTLRLEGVSAEDRREAAADIDREVARLDRIVGDVLDFARPLKVDATPSDLTQLCRDAARSAVEAGGTVPLAFPFDPSLGTVVTDPERVRGVVANLVSNARDSVRARREESEVADLPPVEVGGRRLGPDRVLLWVADRGAGIAPADLPHLFEPYFTTKRTGTGLGLAIARKVVEGLGGAIRVDSREGEGTRIEVELPDGARAVGTDLAGPEGS